MPVITRFAPSPTGPLHLGGARTALFNYLFTRQQSGRIYLRIENSDRARSKPEFEKNIFASLNWLGLKFNNTEIIRQSERLDYYRAALEKLIEKGTAFVSKESLASDTKDKRGEVIRLKNSGRLITFQDLVRGEITFDTRELGDFVIAKDFSEPLYHLAVVVDDAAMGVTHVIRGEDHIANTPRQILIQEALGLPRPSYAHIPLILAPGRTKLSKRHGAVSVLEYHEQGYLPEAVLNYLALLGWNPGTEQEIFSLTELIAQFSLAKVQKSAAVFGVDKLNWLNRTYLKNLPDEVLLTYAPSGMDNSLLKRIIPLLRERIVTLKDISNFLEPEGEFAYFRQAPVLTKELLKNSEHFKPLIQILENILETDFNAEKIKAAVFPYAEEKGRGEVLWPLRAALSGRERSPDPFTLVAVLGKVETLKRLEYAAELV